MKKTAFLSLMLTLMSLVLLTACSDDNGGGTSGDGIEVSGKSGSLTWTYNESTKVLSIEGSGPMMDYNSDSEKSPWGEYPFEKIVIGSGITSIGNYAFINCESLTTITIPNSVTSIGNSAFSGCSCLTSITIPNNVTSIESWAFYSCSSLTSITIPNSVTYIRDHAFGSCYGLTSITIPNSVNYIGDYAFSGCIGLTSIKVETGNTVYDSRGNCNAIIKTATNELIRGCINTRIPNSVTSIGKNAFDACYGLTSITIPNSVTSIGSSAFSGCRDLTSITIPNSVTSIEFGVFMNCSSLASITIPNSVTSIGSSAFSGCSSLTLITIPNSVTSIGKTAFDECSSLTSIKVEPGNPVYDSRDNCNAIIKTATNEFFRGCINTRIPNNVTSLGDYAFSGCSGLISIVIPNGVTSIGRSAFSKCQDLVSIVIPNSVTSIGQSAFFGCHGLKDFYLYAEQVPTTDSQGIGNVMKNVVLHVPANMLNTYQSLSPWKDFASIVALTADDPKPAGARKGSI